MALLGSSGYSSTGTGGFGSSGSTSYDEDTEDGYSAADLRRKYTDFLQSKDAELQEQRIHRHYYHGDQLDKTQLATLQQRGQPATIRDKISRKIDGIVGLLERMKQDPKAYPRTPRHEADAEVATGAIRYICDTNNWPSVAAEEARDGAINGIYGVEFDLEGQDEGDPDVNFVELDNEAFFYDPTSIAHDFSDARYIGSAKWMHSEVVKEMIPGKDDEIDSLVSRGAESGGWQQRDKELRWVDTTSKRLFLIEMWCLKKGEWVGHWFCADKILLTAPSPFLDEKGESAHRYVAASVNVDHDGDRYGYIRKLKPLIDELNGLVSKRQHLINTRRIILTKGAVSDIDQVRREAVRADGVIEVNPMGDEGRFEFDDARTMADIESINKAIEEVTTAIENFGPNASVLGQALENSSGKAIALLQQAGVAELGPGIIANRDWKLRVYRMIWNTIRKYWSAERWIRVTDDEGAARFMGLNVMQLDQMGQPGLVSVGPDGQPMARGGIGELDVDIILDEGPDTLNVMQDTREMLMDLAKAGVQLPPKLLVRASGLPASEKKIILEEMEKAGKPSPFDEAIMKGKAEELALDNAKTAAETEKIKSETGVAAAEAAMGGGNAGPGTQGVPPIDPVAMREAEIKARDSETKAQLAEAQAMAHRASAYKSTADATKTIMETRLMKRSHMVDTARTETETRLMEESHVTDTAKTEMETKVLSRPPPKQKQSKAK